MEENNSINFNEKFNEFINKLNQKEETKQNNKIYIDKEEIEEKTKFEKEQEDKIKVNTNTNNLFNSLIGDLEDKIEHTKFKKRFEYETNDEYQEIKFFLDGKVIFQLDYNDFLFNYNSENFTNKIIDELYIMENSYTLIDFVKKECFVSENILKARFRIKFKDFVNAYVSFAENKYGADKLVSMKKVSAILKRTFNCEQIKYNNVWQLNKITSLEKYKEQLDKYSDYNVNEKKIFFEFIEKYCEVSNDIEPNKRIKRSDFKKVYNAYLEKNNLLKFKLKNDQLKDILLHEFNENFIKYNGNYYMKKIKFKNFSK